MGDILIHAYRGRRAVRVRGMHTGRGMHAEIGKQAERVIHAKKDMHKERVCGEGYLERSMQERPGM